MTVASPTEQARTLFVEALECLAREDYSGAERRLREAHRLVPARVSVLNNLAATLLRQEKSAEAQPYVEESVALDPGNAEGWLNLAFCRRRSGALTEALACCERSLALRPDYADAWSSRGAALLDLQRPAEALESCDRALALRPDHADAWANRGLSLSAVGRPDDAVTAHRQATELAPRAAHAWANLAVALGDLRRYDHALAAYEKAVELGPGRFVLGDRLRAKMQVCDWSGFEAACSRTLAALDAGEPASSPFSLLTIRSSPVQQRRCAELYISNLFPPTGSIGEATERRHGRIRLGYFSCDFRNNAMAYLTAGLFELHDRRRFELFAFSFGPQPRDAMRARVEAAFEHFHDVSAKSDDEVARLARELEIDIAIDLKGLSGYARTGIFARRAAPLQVNYLGYPGTMGAAFMDYLIADRTVVPATHLAHYAESVVWMPHSYWVNDSRRSIAERTPARAGERLPERGFVFCCFNNPAKITPEVFDTWMRLLLKVPGSTLWLLDHNPAATRNLRGAAQDRGVSAERLVFALPQEPSAHLARHRLADLVLDTFYYNAHTTAVDALWTGVPVLTAPGETFASRVCASLLRAVGLPELVAASRHEYEEIALTLALDGAKLHAIRQKLARNIGTQPLFDTGLFTRHLEAAYLAMHERRSRGLAPGRIEVPA